MRKKSPAQVAVDAAEASAEAAQAAVDAAREEVSDAEDEAEAEEDKTLGPLFSLEGEKAKAHVRTRVYREDPVEEGLVGEVGVGALEKDIRRKWGGGTFEVQAVNRKGQIITQRTIKIAGEPIFDSPVARRQYEKWIKQNFGEDEEQQTVMPGMDIDPMVVEESRHQRQIALIKAENEAAIAKARAEAEAAIAKAKSEAAERESADERRRQKERDDRRLEREDQEARDEARYKREREERRVEREERDAIEERRWRAELEIRKQEIANRGDPMQQMLNMAQVLSTLQGSSGPEDPVTAFAMRLPEILQEARATGKEIAAGVAMNKEAKGPKKTEGGFNPARGDIGLQGPIANEMRRAVLKLKQQGKRDDEIERALATKFRELAGVKTTTARVMPKNGATKAAPKKPAPAPAKPQA